MESASTSLRKEPSGTRQPLAQERNRWKAAAASLAFFLALPTCGAAETSNGAPPTAGLPSTRIGTGPAGPAAGGPVLNAPVPAGPLTADPAACCPTGGPGNGGNSPGNCPGPDQHGLLAAIRGSIGGKYDSSCHTPLGLDNFFDGWLDPWVPPGAGSGGAYRTGWVNSPDGFFRREFDQLYSYTRGINGASNEHIGEALLFLPLSRRVEMAIFVPYIEGLVPGSSSVGDMLVTGRIMLIETRDLGVTSGLTVRTPTGSVSTDNGRTDVDPFAELWADLGRGWQVRAGLDANAPLNRRPGLPDAILTASLAVGKSFTGPLGEFTPYLATNFHESFNTTSGSRPAGGFGQGATTNFQSVPAGGSGNVRDVAQYELTPGIHAQLVKGEKVDVHFVWGITIPVTGPRPFDTNNQFFFVLAW